MRYEKICYTTITSKKVYGLTASYGKRVSFFVKKNTMSQFNDTTKPTGTFRFIQSTKKAQQAMQEALAVSREKFKETVDAFLRSGDAELVVYENLVTTVGKTLLAKAVASGLASTTEAKISYQELGTGATAPSYADTGLQTPSGGTRKAITSLAYSANVVSLTAFWAVGEATGTWAEFGTFIGGTETSNSGTLWNRIATSATVASDKALTIDGTIIFT